MGKRKKRSLAMERYAELLTEGSLVRSGLVGLDIIFLYFLKATINNS